MTDEDDGLPHFEMIMPFVVVDTEGGPFDDASYCAGYEAGRWASKVEAAKSLRLDVQRETVHRANLPQLDLVAMRYGAQLAVHDWQEDIDEGTQAQWAVVSVIWNTEPVTSS